VKQNYLGKIKVKNLKIVKLHNGNVMKVLKKNELKKWSFGEAYFSKIKFKKIKAWKLHKKMNLNLTVPHGKVKFVFYSQESKKFKVIVIGEKKYLRISVPPKIWFGFKGVSKKESIILNIADISHSPHEVLRKEENKIKFKW